MKRILLAMLVLAGLAVAQNGAQVYTRNCVGCHQATGAGIPGVFPPLAGHVPSILAAKGGRQWLIHSILFGLQGQITVAGKTYNGAMPAWQQLSDADIAAMLNHISTQWGNKFPAGQKPFTPAEVKAERGKKLTAQQVNTARQKLGLK